MAGARPRRLGLAVVVSLLLAVAAGGIVFGPQIAPSLLSANGALARAKRKFLQLRAFALFRARGDRAVLRGGEPVDPARPRATKRATPAP